MRFLGKAWRLLVGVKDGLVLVFMLLFFGLLYALLSATPYAGSADEGALLLDLGGAIVEQPVETDPLEIVSGSSLIREYRLRDVVHALETAATDDAQRNIARSALSWEDRTPCRQYRARSARVRSEAPPENPNSTSQSVKPRTAVR